MPEVVGGQRWLPVIPSGKTEAHLCGKGVVGGGGKSAMPPRGQRKNQASAYRHDTQAEHDKTLDRGTEVRIVSSTYARNLLCAQWPYNRWYLRAILS